MMSDDSGSCAFFLTAPKLVNDGWGLVCLLCVAPSSKGASIQLCHANRKLNPALAQGETKGPGYQGNLGRDQIPQPTRAENQFTYEYENGVQESVARFKSFRSFNSGVHCGQLTVVNCFNARCSSGVPMPEMKL